MSGQLYAYFTVRSVPLASTHYDLRETWGKGAESGVQSGPYALGPCFLGNRNRSESLLLT
eukprot:4714611-Prymnesium_polylepis.2